jgi:hypothetical protein
MACRHIFGLLGAVVLLTLTAGCQGAAYTGPRLADGKPNPSLNGLPSVSPTRHVLVGSMILCLTKPGRAVITKIRLADVTGRIEVTGFTVRPNPALTGGEMIGAVYGTLHGNGLSIDRSIDVQCDAANSGRGDELVVELGMPAGTDAATSAFQIDYTAAEQRGTLTFPQGAVLCSAPSMTYEPCARLSQRYQRHL